ncbi:MAG: hypothetical protein MUF49_31895 [Oculatellaceae cyanobacterium Prado106]|jgi:hypothetical protein|nr:hypothetical protein [Oculatellaceae cyanobacterium Prado106]
MTDLAKDAASAIELLTRYSFDLSGYTADRLVDYWLHRYPSNWIRLAVTEALYQGRYKVISVEQILNLWRRRGRPVYHFNPEFERIISPRFPRGSASKLAGKGTPAPSPAAAEAVPSAAFEAEEVAVGFADSPLETAAEVPASGGWRLEAQSQAVEQAKMEQAEMEQAEMEQPEMEQAELDEIEPMRGERSQKFWEDLRSPKIDLSPKEALFKVDFKKSLFPPQPHSAESNGGIQPFTVSQEASPHNPLFRAFGTPQSPPPGNSTAAGNPDSIPGEPQVFEEAPQDFSRNGAGKHTQDHESANLPVPEASTAWAEEQPAAESSEEYSAEEFFPRQNGATVEALFPEQSPFEFKSAAEVVEEPIQPFQPSAISPLDAPLEDVPDSKPAPAAPGNHPIHQFVPTPEPSDFYAKLKAFQMAAAKAKRPIT